MIKITVFPSKKSLVKKVSDIQKLPDDKRQVVMALLDAFLKQIKLQSIM
ncbi:hypothetical protein [Phaeodactylibacter xiamenensis]|nr:hypothetical protein [Phaeodactylibacter xiamenensis]